MMTYLCHNYAPSWLCVCVCVVLSSSTSKCIFLTDITNGVQ